MKPMTTPPDELSPESVAPEPEVVAKPQRQRFSAEYTSAGSWRRPRLARSPGRSVACFDPRQSRS